MDKLCTSRSFAQALYASEALSDIYYEYKTTAFENYILKE